MRHGNLGRRTQLEKGQCSGSISRIQRTAIRQRKHGWRRRDQNKVRRPTSGGTIRIRCEIYSCLQMGRSIVKWRDLHVAWRWKDGRHAVGHQIIPGSQVDVGNILFGDIASRIGNAGKQRDQIAIEETVFVVDKRSEDIAGQSACGPRRASRTFYPLRPSRARGALRPGRPRWPSRASYPLWSSCACRALRTGGAGCAHRSLRAGRPCGASRACRPLKTGSATYTLRPSGPHCARWALWASRACWAGRAIFSYWPPGPAGRASGSYRSSRPSGASRTVLTA